jgi:hypothetical protein
MVVLENSVDIAVPREVFDYLSDMRNEAVWNQNVRSVRLLSGDSLADGLTAIESPGFRPARRAPEA